MSEIELKHLSKQYPDQEDGFAVKDVNLKIQDGEFIIFVGPSGCGKSTTLRMIAGLEDITEGELYINGERANEQKPKDRELAMVFQDYALYPHMNVHDNLAYPLKLAKVPKDEQEETIQTVSELLGLKDFLDRKPKNLSGGQKQRVALGRAIVREPNAFLMDEPLSNLDAKLRVQMRYEISRLHRRLGTTIIYVTHDQTEAMTMGDRLVVMNAGEIQQIGSPQEVYRNPANLFVAEFLGTPKINLLAPEAFGEEGQAFQEQHAPKADRLRLGVRPENLTISSGDDYEISLLEHLGGEQYLYLDAPKNRSADEKIIVRAEAEADFQEGEHVHIAVRDWSAVVAFDPDSGERLI